MYVPRPFYPAYSTYYFQYNVQKMGLVDCGSNRR